MSISEKKYITFLNGFVRVRMQCPAQLQVQCLQKYILGKTAMTSQ